MALSVVPGKVRTLVVIWSSSEFDLNVFTKKILDDEHLERATHTELEEGSKTIERLLSTRYSGGRVFAILFEGDKLLSTKPEGPGILASYISPRAPDPDITLVFPRFAPAYYPAWFFERT